MTGNELVEPALRLLGVLDEIQNASAEQSSTGLVVLNDMMADLSGDGVDLGYAPQSDPAVDNGMNIESRQALKFMLAVCLSPIYTKPITPVIAAEATMGRNKLLRDAIYQTRQPSTMTHAPLGEAFAVRTNILTGN
jgi:hypothetical protein